MKTITINVSGLTVEVARCNQCRALMSPWLMDTHMKRHAGQDKNGLSLTGPLATSEWKKRRPFVDDLYARRKKRCGPTIFPKRTKQMSHTGIEKSEGIPRHFRGPQ